MQNAYYLPEKVSLDEAMGLYREQERARHGDRANIAYVNHGKEIFRDNGKRDLCELIKNKRAIRRASTLVVWHINQINDVEKTCRALDERKQDCVVVRVLNPVEITLDPASKESRRFAMALSAVEKKRKSSLPTALDDGMFIKKLANDEIDKIREARKEGLTYAQIGKQYGFSSRTVAKYAKGIVPPKKEEERAKTVEEKGRFDYSKLKFDVKELSRIEEVSIGFLRNKRTDATRHTYYRDLKKFFAWFEESFFTLSDPEQIDEEHLQCYLEYLRDYKKHKDNVILRAFSGLSSFFSYLKKRGMVRHNHVRRLELPKRESHVVETEGLDDDEVKRILEHAVFDYREQISEFRKSIAHRNLIMVYLLLSAGMRDGALINLRKHDISRKYGVTILRLRAKSGSHYTVSVDDKAAKMLQGYVETYLNDAPEAAYLFSSKAIDGVNQLCNSDVNKMIKRLCRKAGITKRVTGHSFRVTNATMNANQMSVHELKQRMGHKDIRQTSAYVKLAHKRITNDWLPELDEGLFDLRGEAAHGPA